MTTSTGCAEFELTEAPYLVLARLGQDVSLLGLNGENRQSLSQFTMPSRATPTTAYEAFLYLERGICRGKTQDGTRRDLVLAKTRFGHLDRVLLK